MDEYYAVIKNHCILLSNRRSAAVQCSELNLQYFCSAAPCNELNFKDVGDAEPKAARAAASSNELSLQGSRGSAVCTELNFEAASSAAL
jgi:hypothetical protein